MDNSNLKILCIIPARSGSKSFVDKNIYNICEKPMLAWSILHALNSKYNKNIRIIVSTDDEDYAKIARQYGAETPFLRPKEISGDLSTDLECIKHTSTWLETNHGYKSDIILHLRPTQPFRKIVDLDNCLDLFIEQRHLFDSLRTVIELEKTPYKMYSIDNNTKELIPLFTEINGIKECYNQCRQILPNTYLHNGYIDILNKNILNNNTLSGKKILSYLMKKNNCIDIDFLKDLNNLEITTNGI